MNKLLITKIDFLQTYFDTLYLNKCFKCILSWIKTLRFCFALDSFVNNTEGQGSNKLIIDGVFSNGAWVSLYGDRSSLIYTNFFKDEALGSENDRVNIRPSSSIHLAEYDWTSQPGLHNTRTILCRYYP